MLEEWFGLAVQSRLFYFKFVRDLIAVVLERSFRIRNFEMDMKFSSVKVPPNMG
jgi:hypothetical protein